MFYALSNWREGFARPIRSSHVAFVLQRFAFFISQSGNRQTPSDFGFDRNAALGGLRAQTRFDLRFDFDGERHHSILARALTHCGVPVFKIRHLYLRL